MFSLNNLLLVFIGGGIGSISRYIATTLIGSVAGTFFPFGTLFVNVTGSFIMGFIMMLGITASLIPEHLRLLLAIGFLGGFTTFSSFSMETLLLLKGESFFYAGANIAANMLLSLTATWLGWLAARML
jgi:fluoride exporter